MARRSCGWCPRGFSSSGCSHLEALRGRAGRAAAGAQVQTAGDDRERAAAASTGPRRRRRDRRGLDDRRRRVHGLGAGCRGCGDRGAGRPRDRCARRVLQRDVLGTAGGAVPAVRRHLPVRSASARRRLGTSGRMGVRRRQERHRARRWRWRSAPTCGRSENGPSPSLRSSRSRGEHRWAHRAPQLSPGCCSCVAGSARRRGVGGMDVGPS